MYGNNVDGGAVQITTNSAVTDGPIQLGPYTNQDTLTLAVNGSAAFKSTVSAVSYLKNGKSVVGSLPTCNAGAEGAHYGATDLLTPTFLTVAVGGGTVHGSVYCNGTAWVTD